MCFIKIGGMNKLEYFGNGAWISSHLAGRQIKHFEQDGEWLICVTTCGHRAKIGWQDIHGNQLKGSPFLENMDVDIVLPGIQIGGKVNM